MTCERCDSDFKIELTEAFDAALDHAIATGPKTRQEFSWLMMCYLIGWLDQAKRIDPAIKTRHNGLSDHYGQLSLGKEVINDARGY